MSNLRRILQPPRYGYENNGVLIIPTHRQIFSEFLSKFKIFEDRKNWLPFFSWTTSLALAIPFFIFFIKYFSWPLAFVGFFYSMVIMGGHGTFWFHRYSTHRAFRFKNKFVRSICRNLVIKILPEEVYVISHHVHHKYSEQPGDPYNAHGGWLYCFLADATHQGINRQLSPKDYQLLCSLMSPTGVNLNSYEQYQKWGSLCHPAWTVLHFIVNWSFWFLAFYLIGGPALAIAIFGWAGVWAFGVRTFNYEGHGRGKDRRKKGVDFSKDDISINQMWPGYVSGEWHSNHHLYPTGARAGFLKYQLDLPWLFIKALEKCKAVDSVRDFKEDFLRDHYLPYKAENLGSIVPVSSDYRTPLNATIE